MWSLVYGVARSSPVWTSSLIAGLGLAGQPPHMATIYANQPAVLLSHINEPATTRTSQPNILVDGGTDLGKGRDFRRTEHGRGGRHESERERGWGLSREQGRAVRRASGQRGQVGSASEGAQRAERTGDVGKVGPDGRRALPYNN